MNVGFSNLLWRHDKSWISRKVRSVNLRLHRALYGCGKCHIHGIKYTSFQREDFTTHGLYINSRGKKMLTLLTVKSFGDKNMSGASIIHVIPVKKSLPLFSLNAKAQRCLKCTDCSYQEFRNQDRIIDSSNSLKIFHQDIRGLSSKTDYLMHYLKTCIINPHILCFSKHHTEEQDLLHLILPGWFLL